MDEIIARLESAVTKATDGKPVPIDELCDILLSAASEALGALRIIQESMKWES